jgi:DNA-binding protein YbaB
MFNQLKQLKDLRDRAKNLQDALASQTVTIEQNGVTLVIDGNQKVKSVKINPELTPEDLENILPPLLNEADEKVKRLMAQTMQTLGGFDLPGM